MRDFTLPATEERHHQLVKQVNTLQQKEKEDHATVTRQIHDVSSKQEATNQELKKTIERNAKANIELFDNVSKKFEETVTKLDSDKRMIEGVKAFCQLVRANLLENQRGHET